MRSLERSLYVARSAPIFNLGFGFLSLGAFALSFTLVASVAERVIFSLDVMAASGLAGLFFTSEFIFEEATYEATVAYSTSQGLFSQGLSGWSLFNPGADIDLSTTTDFEDCAGPAADIVEFTDQDRALLGDSIFLPQSRQTLIGVGVGALAGLAATRLSNSMLKRKA